jgi:CheY-like chemotaxis protein
VDDEPLTARVLGQLLSQHDVTVAHSGREAIARLGSDAAFDAIVCDLQMTEGSGVDVYEWLLAQAPALSRRIIFTTGGAFTPRAREFLERCEQPVIDKPFDTARLVALVDGIAGRA